MAKVFIGFGSRAHFVEDLPFTMNNGEYLVESGTWIPIRKQFEEMKRAGVDLMAHRMAHSDYVNGAVVNLDDEFVDYRELDEFDLDAKRDFYLRQELLANQEEYNRRIAEQKELEELRKSSNNAADESSKTE